MSFCGSEGGGSRKRLKRGSKHFLKISIFWRGDRGRQKGGGKKSASDYRDDGIREGHRNIEVDMSLEAMKRRWALYQKHWEKEEGRMQELEELKTVSHFHWSDFLK